MAGKQVVLDGQILHGSDRFGIWRVHSLEGWDESPPEKTGSADVVNGHGTVSAPVYYGQRTVLVKGRLSAGGPELAVDAKRRLSALLQGPGSLVVVSSDGVALTAVARRGRITPGSVSGRWLTFEMELKFDDPFRYGSQRVFQGAAGDAFGVFQRGYSPAWPVLTVTGNFPGGYEVTLNGRTVSVNKPLASGSTHTLDMRTGILRQNGTRIYGAIDMAEYFTINPGMKQSFWSNPLSGGSGTFKLSLRDTYI